MCTADVLYSILLTKGDYACHWEAGMGIVLCFRHHGDASAVGLKPKRLLSGSPRPRDSSSSENLKKYSEGITPFAFQFETAGVETPASCATAAEPPSAVIKASTEVIMPDPSSSLLLNLSSVPKESLPVHER